MAGDVGKMFNIGRKYKKWSCVIEWSELPKSQNLNIDYILSFTEIFHMVLHLDENHMRCKGGVHKLI